MLRESDLHAYQLRAVDHVVQNPACALFLEMGLGKTVSVLTAINRLMYEDLEVMRVLVIAPLRVASDTWPQEAAAWEHTRHLKIAKAIGTEEQRKAALCENADIYVINRENTAWLFSYFGGSFPFDMLVIDELSGFKSHQSIRFKTLRMVRPQIKRVVGLTGTPSPNGLSDLWAQMYLIDMGERLGKTVTCYRDEYLVPGRRNGAVIYNYREKAGAVEAVRSRLSDIVISMKSADYLELPPRLDIPHELTLPAPVRARYEDFEREEVLRIAGEKDALICVANAAALSSKLLQFASGAVYDGSGTAHETHAVKTEALREIVEAAAGEPLLVFYAFRHEAVRIRRVLKAYRVVEPADRGALDDWNAGRADILLAHPASAGHGLNLQKGGHIIVWFGLPWSLELFQQANARLHRQGQAKPVQVHYLLCRDTLDMDVIRALEGKRGGQEALMDALNVRIKKYAG